MVNRPNRREDKPGLSLEFLSFCQGIYSCTQAVNQMSAQAKEVFGDCKTPEQVYKKAERLDKISSEENRQLIGGGANYAAFKLFLSKGDISTAREMVRVLVSQDNVYDINNKAVSELGLSIEELCIKEQELLSPEKLDHLMFSRYAPESIGLHNCYEDKEGLAVISQKLPDKDYHVRFILESYTGKQIKIDDLEMTIASGKVSVRGGGFNTNASIEPTKKFCLECFSKSNVAEPGIILANNHDFIIYLATKYTFNRLGKMINIGTPLKHKNKSKWV